MLLSQSELFKYPHLILGSQYTKTELYKSKPKRGPEFQEFQRDIKTHSDLLRLKLRQTEDSLLKANQERRAIGIKGNEGVTVVFVSEADFELKYESLGLHTRDIELLNVKKIQNSTLASVFIPEGKLRTFFTALDNYCSEHPKHKKLFANIADIQKATAEALWTDDPALLPSDNQPIWWEIWLRAGKDKNSIESYFRQNAEHVGIRLDQNSIVFPERTVLLGYATLQQIAQSIDLLNCIAELRKAKENPSFFMRMPRREQQEWINDCLQRIKMPLNGDVSVLILDTGVNRAHPLLKSSLTEQDMHSFEEAWHNYDHHGHGTEMAGLALYGDLVTILSDTKQIYLSHYLESGKILPPPPEKNDPKLYGYIISQVISRAEIQAPFRKRIISMAVTAPDYRDRGKPSSWSSAIDKITSGYDDNIQRLFIISAGNSDPNARKFYPENLISEQGIHDPAQAWNSLCVGAYTEKVFFNSGNYPNNRVLADVGNLSPCSSTSTIWDDQWPLKPDVVFEGGNNILDSTCDSIDCPDELQLLSTFYKFNERFFTLTGDTSAATAQIARLAASIQAQYPEYWPETIRALIVHSAEWTEAMIKQWDPIYKNKITVKKNVENLIRYCGFGVPDLTKALKSAQNCLTLIAQRTLQPFSKNSMKDMHIHQLPWPVKTLENLENTPVELKITLSYFIDPNPGERGWKKRHSYASHSLRFDLNTPYESLDQFRNRINKAAIIAETTREQVTTGDSKQWFLGNKARHKGSLHCDIWKGTAIELAQRRYLGVYPVIGWWRENIKQERYENKARYALVVSISTPEEKVRLYTEIANSIGIKIETEI